MRYNSVAWKFSHATGDHIKKITLSKQVY